MRICSQGSIIAPEDSRIDMLIVGAARWIMRVTCTLDEMQREQHVVYAHDPSHYRTYPKPLKALRNQNMGEISSVLDMKHLAKTEPDCRSLVADFLGAAAPSASRNMASLVCVHLTNRQCFSCAYLFTFTLWLVRHGYPSYSRTSLLWEPS